MSAVRRMDLEVAPGDVEVVLRGLRVDERAVRRHHPDLVLVAVGAALRAIGEVRDPPVAFHVVPRAVPAPGGVVRNGAGDFGAVPGVLPADDPGRVAVEDIAEV